MQMNFRSSINGFNRDDVVHYIEYLNTKHTAEINQMNSELDYLRTQQPATVSSDLEETIAQQASRIRELFDRCKQLEQELDEQINNLKAQLAQQGLTIEMYCSFMNTTEEKLREDARPNAEISIRVQAAIEQIVALENLTAEEEEINQAVAHVARQNNMTLEQLKPYYDAEFEAAIVRSVLTGKAMKVIRDSAIILEK